MKKAAKISLISLAAAVPAVGIATTIALIFTKKNSSTVVITEQDKKLVNRINECIETHYSKTHSKFNTMSDLLSYLNSDECNNIDLPSQQITSTGVQFVWDMGSEGSISQPVFLMKDDGTVGYGPEGYTINQDETKLWRMVKASNSVQLHAAVNGNGVTINTFSQNAKYSQYLRDGFTENTSLSFVSGLDTGNNKKLNLTFNPTTTYDDAVVINTSVSTLEVKGSTDIEHYGNLSELKVSLDDSGVILEEYGSVDAAITIESGSISAEKGSDINQIIVTSESKEEAIQNVKVTVADGGSVGVVGANVQEVAEVLTAKKIVTQDEGAEVGKVETSKSTPTPQTEDPNKFYTGDGTATSPWCIKNWEQLKLFATKVANQEFPVSGQTNWYFNLVDDITIPSDQIWTPVGTYENPFKGVFNGCGFTISGVKVNRYSEHTTSETYKGYMGFFGITEGSANTSFNSASKDTIWNDTDKELDKTVFAQDKYTTQILNLTLSNATIEQSSEDTTATQENGAVVGRARNTYFENVHVTSGKVVGYKAIGGLAGTVVGCALINCSAGTKTTKESENLVVTAKQRNVGGLVGVCAYESETLADICEAFIKCTNYSIVYQNNESNKTGGVAGGVVGWCQQDNESEGYTVFEDCTNAGDIHTVAGWAAGISEAQRTWIYNRCTNAGNITLTNPNQISGLKLGGIGTYGIAKCYDCHNTGNISGWCDYMGGIIGYGYNGHLANYGFDECTNTGTLTVPQGCTCQKGTIASGLGSVILSGNTFETVEDLNNAISSSEKAVNIELQGVTVNHPETGTLKLPKVTGSILSDTHVADTMEITDSGTGYMSIKIAADEQNKPININITGQCPNADIRNYSPYSTLTVAENATCKAAIVVGTEGKVINNGTISGVLGIDGYATYGKNSATGTCGSVTFGYTSDRLGHGAKTLDNRGTIKTIATGNNQHVLFSVGGSDCSITVNNYGTIEYEAATGFTGVYGYLMCLYNTNAQNNVINCFNGSHLITSHPTSYRFALKTDTDLYHEDGAEFKADTTSITTYQEWKQKLEGGRVHVYQKQ